ncbi:succinate/fumarate mitochondrial transporter-like protein [Pseudovirgaria hyperparasitica]|uniref:Succinate/fumarate mitochondrial transporter-like protein n=1 Tax=Pseudovirgaria hyperparasitica TaxID=470096 RepID=A0A6A6W9B8_9PEZI|nr:succinate/fumarate mitochondrial transporter-like protein [Pseudovirgaria hyperparasitica]KAF2759145.1 succinate/fumarate mitochondrial transporter-like protein [Pseudovirgaria hyperparasitica]
MADRQQIVINFAAGGGAGTVEAFACHPLDTIKTRMQLCRVVANAGPSLSFIGTTTSIVTHEGVFALYNGLSAVLLGMGPKIAIRFSSFEFYKSLFQKPDRAPQSHVLFLSGLAAGVTEAITVLNPMDVLKIRLQAQKAASAQISPNATAPVSARPSLSVVLKNMIEKEGVFALYRGVGLTAVRQGTTQAVNFTVYNILKDLLRKYQPDKDVLPSWQTMGIGLFAGASGPICNAPLDTVKTRVQSTTGKFSVSQVPGMIAVVAREEGVRALWRGITPRLLRVAPGQAVSFTVYEFLKGLLQKSG